MTKKRKVIFVTAGSLILVVAAIGTIVLFGYTSTPGFESLKDHPDSTIEGTVAYLEDNNNGNTCLYVIPAGGGDGRQVRCGDQLYSATIAFTTGGDLVMSTQSFDTFQQTKYEVIDGKTLQQKDAFSIHDDGIVNFKGDTDPQLFTNAGRGFGSLGLFDGGDSAHTVWVATDADGNDRLLSRKAPADYDFAAAKYSPDQKWFIAQTNQGDLLIGDKKGSARRLVVGKDDGDDFSFASVGSGFVWFQPGQTRGTVNVDDLKKTSQEPNTDKTTRSYVQTLPL